MKKILLFTLLLLFSQAARAQVIDSTFYRWSVYEIQENELEHKKCYITSYPNKIETNHNTRARPWIMITRYQKDRSEEVSVYGGYVYKLNSEIFLMIDNKLLKMKAKRDFAWAHTRSDDIAIIQTMLRGGVLRIRSNSAIGTYAVDEYSLKGMPRAYARMKEICK